MLDSGSTSTSSPLSYLWKASLSWRCRLGLYNSHQPRDKVETSILLDVRLRKEYGYNNTGQSNAPLQPLLQGVIAQDQCSWPFVGGRWQSPSLPLDKIQKRKNIVENLIYLLQVAHAKIWWLSKLMMETSCGTQIIILATDLIQISYLRTNKTALG